MLMIKFEGWFQCRLASDPDPTNEPRGISGCSFALVGEPDLDRVIRLQPEGVVPRPLGPQVGVKVTSVIRDGQAAPSHPLNGAEVELLDEAKFVEQNGAVVARNTAFIDPFCISFSLADGSTWQRSALWNPEEPGESYYEVDAKTLKLRQPQLLETNSLEVLSASGIIDPQRYIAQRLEQLKAMQCKDGDELEQAQLEQRIDALELTDWRAKRLELLLGARVLYKFALNEKLAADKVPPGCDAAVDWPIELWMGGWDNDTLCAYTKGALSIPESGNAP